MLDTHTYTNLPEKPTSIVRCTLPGRSTMLPPHFHRARVLLLFLFVAALLPHGNAMTTTKINVTSRAGAATPAAADGNTARIVDIYPRVVLLDGGMQYELEMENGRALDNIDLFTLMKWDNLFRVGWRATLSSDKNTVLFTAGLFPYAGLIEIAIGAGADTSTAITNTLKVHFVRPEETEATFTAPNPYYGMQLQVSAKLPIGYTASGHLLVGSSENCQKITTNCNADTGCYDVTNVMRLPPPGSYHLCVTATGWGNRYLPWGQRTLEVKALFSLPLTFVAGTVPSVNIHDAVSEETVNSVASKRYTVMCKSGTCPTVTSQKGERMVDADVCYKSSSGDRVYLSDTQPIVNPGTYALCVEDASGLVSSAAIPVTVVPKPFALEVVDVSKGLARVHVSGGDIESRQEKYAVCVALYGAPCSLVTLSGNQCTWSTRPNAGFVDVATSEAISINSMTFCLVSRNLTYNGRVYLHVPVGGKYKLDGSVNSASTNDERFWIPIVIGVACGSLLIGIIVITVWCCRRRKERTSKTSCHLDDDRDNVMERAEQSMSGEVQSLWRQSRDGDHLCGVNAPYADSSDYSFSEEPVEGLEKKNDAGH